MEDLHSSKHRHIFTSWQHNIPECLNLKKQRRWTHGTNSEHTQDILDTQYTNGNKDTTEMLRIMLQWHLVHTLTYIVQKYSMDIKYTNKQYINQNNVLCATTLIELQCFTPGYSQN
jgi:hypothetical protein